MSVSPVGDGVASEAVRDEHDRFRGPLDHAVEFGDPFVPVRRSQSRCSTRTAPLRARSQWDCQ